MSDNLYPKGTVESVNGTHVVLTGIDLARITIHDYQTRIRAINEANGWFDSERTPVEGHMLMVTEVAEATEAYRKWGLDDATAESDGTVTVKPEGVGSEYADILIRLLDQCERDGVDLVTEVERKLTYNQQRGYRHGGKKL